jgi:hypothetical protein
VSLLAPLAHGLRSTRRRPALVLIVYLVSLAPTALVAAVAWDDLAGGLDHRPFAAEALAGNRHGVWNDLRRDPQNDLSAAFGTFFSLGLLTVLAQVAVSAGLVEALFSRGPRGEHPFLLGIGRHGWRFLRSAVWFGGALVALGTTVWAGIGLVDRQAAAAADARLQVGGWVAVVVLGLAAFAALDLAYDLSRVAAAAHGDRRTLRGFVAALGHALGHPLRLVPLWGSFAAAALLLHAAYLALYGSLSPVSPGEAAGLFAVQQALFLALAALRVAFWGAEIGYYQAVGEPRWCGAGRERRGAGRRASG